MSKSPREKVLLLKKGIMWLTFDSIPRSKDFHYTCIRRTYTKSWPSVAVPWA